ncbi:MULTISPECIES: twin-arginine translocase TatA/TatE family subunit [unclassified Cryobacterium]|uniref:twin-arginine translocase TatA/TatE family subunit n=1 Tax=unclassified Cryobacterium TaxID=2649013 RepID=UPI002AB4A3D0|nr:MULTISPECIES: twin-arginine translocase TatA/TatE family subunit [Cryobacterium]MDY7526383.1 twin-arginine translocase TatA/TatE family subunit [Cryobacterium sp. 10C2]MDY7557812.1 twin-arginine translocase TatA/TatE family subunit [Cryobacterium sp. 10C3]MEB0004685.1 twin-arginine translocase TatA/TatE family subunit [Cryobacterium sp. RTC2.1]MEB0203435.1 twin-arginine translocase TatA/TatE family subunit [Cryobacterium sp. 5I3]MEB0287749.1 twin-arginine translocase TatA/TatE family subuni
MLGNLTGWHFLIILAIILLLFGAPKLPGLARSVGQSMKILKAEIKTEPDVYDTPVPDTSVPAPAPPGRSAQSATPSGPAGPPPAP